MADLITGSEAAELIRSGRPMLIAGSSSQLARLPKGQWIGGSTAYFMTDQGGVVDHERVFVTVLAEPVTSASIRIYGEAELPRIAEDYPRHGCSFIIIPAGSPTQLRFARDCANWEGLFNAPLVGWNSGALLNDPPTDVPCVFDGRTSQSFENAAAVLHAATDEQHVARIEIINPFRQSNGDKIEFPTSGVTVTDCLVNGQPQDFATYLLHNAIDVRWPLVADYAGAQINVSFKVIDESPKRVQLFSPVFAGVEYRLAQPIANLAEFFGKEFAARRAKPAFSCNCILNFLYAELEGKRTGEATGPITFGEIAYIQLNQTFVYVTFESRP